MTNLLQSTSGFPSCTQDSVAAALTETPALGNERHLNDMCKLRESGSVQVRDKNECSKGYLINSDKERQKFVS